jgi:hypothetical protein
METEEISETLVLCRIAPLLGKHLETNNETTAVATQRSGKHASTSTELLLETVFSTRSVQRDYKEDIWATQSVESQPAKRRLMRLVWNGRQPESYQLRVEFCKEGCEDGIWTQKMNNLHC